MAVYVKAQAKGVAMTPRKVGEVASLVRGRTVADALVILEHTPRRAAIPVTKVIKSAQANATHNHSLQAANLEIAELHVSPGPRMKRYRPVARGSAHPYQKRTTHITVIVSGIERAKKSTASKAEKPATKSTATASKKESK